MRILITLRGETSTGIQHAVGVKIITGSLVTLENVLPQNYHYRYRLEILTHSLNYHYRYHLASAVTPSFPLVPNCLLERHFN